MRRSLLSCGMVLLVLSAPLAAQAPLGPDDVARQVFRADSVDDWRALLALAHPDAIREFRDFAVRALRFDVDEFPNAGEISECMRREIARANRVELDSVYRVPSVEALATLAPDTAFARYRMWRARLPRSVPGDTLMPSPRRVYLGHLQADDSTAYGVVLEIWDHLPMPDWPARRPQTLTFRRWHGSWRTMLDVDFLRANARVLAFEGCQ